MKVRILLVAALLSVSVASLAQTPMDVAASNRVQEKMRKLDLLNLILPVLLTPEQLKVLLPAIEKARKEESELKSKEASLLRQVETDIDKALAAGLENKQVVPGETMGKLNTTVRALTITRSAFIDAQVTAMVELVEKTLDSGQKKAAIGLVEPKWINAQKPDEVKDETRLRFWVGVILMDNLSYDILVKLSRAKS